MSDPNMQNLPRVDPSNADALENLIRNMIVASPGHILYARDFCVDPKSLILKADLTWCQAVEIQAGDNLIGFDEDFSKHIKVGKGNRLHNAFRPASVRATRIISREKVRVVTDCGESVVAANHPFLARQFKGRRRWVNAVDLTSGDHLMFLNEPWETDHSREGGYLAGFLDGEGYVHRTNVGFGQNQGATLNHVLATFEAKGFRLTQHGRKTNKNFQYACVSGVGHQLKLLGSIRPTRLLPKAESMWNGRCISGKCSRQAKVLRVEPLGVGDVIAIETSTATFISDGFFSHNSGIEAKIVGYEALYPEYIRLCNLDVHSFYTAWALSQVKPGAIPVNDLPQLSWDDDKLRARLKEIKKDFGRERNNLYKHLVHGANFMQGAKGATDTILRMTGQIVPVSTVSRVMSIYFELFPKIRKWHTLLLAQANRDGFLRNPFGYVHRFHSVYTWEKIGNEWQKEPGPSANQVIAFLPQSTAAGIIKEAMLRLWDHHYDAVAQYLRLLVHDELFFEVPLDHLEVVDRICRLEMEKPILQMKMPADWNMGEYFMVSTEAKQGECWGNLS